MEAVDNRMNLPTSTVGRDMEIGQAAKRLGQLETERDIENGLESPDNRHQRENTNSGDSGKEVVDEQVTEREGETASRD